MKDDKIIQSNIKGSFDETAPEREPSRVKSLDATLMPWAAGAAFKTLHMLSVLEEEAGSQVKPEALSEELGLPNEKVVAMLKVGRTILTNPMPVAFSRVCLMFEQLSEAMHEIKNESSDETSVRIATDVLGRIESTDPGSGGIINYTQ